MIVLPHFLFFPAKFFLQINHFLKSKTMESKKENLKPETKIVFVDGRIDILSLILPRMKDQNWFWKQDREEWQGRNGERNDCDYERLQKIFVLHYFLQNSSVYQLMLCNGYPKHTLLCNCEGPVLRPPKCQNSSNTQVLNSATCENLFNIIGDPYEKISFQNKEGEKIQDGYPDSVYLVEWKNIRRDQGVLVLSLRSRLVERRFVEKAVRWAVRQKEIVDINFFYSSHLHNLFALQLAKNERVQSPHKDNHLVNHELGRRISIPNL
jgi:hypothetical protein